MAITLLIDPFAASAARSSLLSTKENTAGRKRARRVSENSLDLAPPEKKQRVLREKKSVHFHNLVLVAFVGSVEDVDAPNVWYSSADMRASKQRDQKMIREQLTEDFGEALVDVLEATMTTSSSPSLKPQSCAAVAQSPFRGLEREMLPCFRQRKRQVAANVLKSQAALRAWKVLHPEKPADHTAMILATHCRRLARPSKQFARLLAQADAMAAL